MPSLLAPAQVATDSCLVRVSDPGALQFVDGGDVGSDPISERRQEILARFQASSGHRDSVWLPISQQMYHAWRAAVGCPAATIQSMTPTQIVEALTAADTLGDGRTVGDICTALRAPCHSALGLALPRALLHSKHAGDHTSSSSNPRRFSVSWLSRILVSLSAELATTLLRTALVPTLHQPPAHPSHASADAEARRTAEDCATRPPPLWFPDQLAQFSPALAPLLVHALAPSLAAHRALALDLLLYPAARDIATAVLPGFQNLETVHLALSHNAEQLTDTFFERMIYHVCTVPALRALRLSRLGRRGACVAALAETLPHAAQLTALALEDLPLKRAAGAELVESLRKLPVLERVELRECPADDATLTRLRRTLREMRGLRELALHRMKLPPRIAMKLVADIVRLPALNVLTLDESLTELLAAPRGGGSGGSSGSDGATTPDSGCSGDSRGGAEPDALVERLAAALGSAAKLCELRITQSVVEAAPPLPAGAAAAAAPLPRTAAACFGDALARHLCRAVSLTHLHLSAVVRGGCLGDLLSSVPQLRSFTVHGAPLDDIAAESLALGLRKARKLHHLDLSHCKASDAGILLLSASLRSCSRMRVLRLCRCGGSAAAAAALAESLPSLPLLQELDVDGWGMGPEGMRVLAPALSGTRGLRVLNVAWNRIATDGVRALVHNLTSPELLHSLNLKFNCIGNAGMHALAPALRRARSLSELELGGNMFGAEGMETLCGILLREPVPDGGPPPQVQPMGPCVPRSQCAAGGPEQLRVLGLSGCAVGVDGVRTLSAAVPKLPALRVLDFPDLLLMFKLHRSDLFRAMASMRSANPLLCVRT